MNQEEHKILKYGIGMVHALDSFQIDKKDNDITVKANNKDCLFSTRKNDSEVPPVLPDCSWTAQPVLDALLMEMAIEQTLISISEDTILQFEGSGNATVYICVSGGVDVTIRENVLGGYINLRIVLIVSSGSTARYVVNRSVSHTGHNVILRQSEIADRAHLSWVGVEFHSLNSVSHYISHLVGYGASTDHSIAFMNSGVDVSDIYTKNRHSAENTYSNIYVKGVLEDSATCFYRGLIEMEEGMSGSVGHEKARILMLDSNTKCNTVPSLSVRHDDVKCSHSVSVSRLDEDQMFYLKSRGMDENSAREIMKEAHLTDILMKL